MVKRLMIYALLLSGSIRLCQAKGDFSKTGVLRLYTTISPEWMTRYSVMNTYIHGGAQYYVEERVALFGDTYYFVDTQTGGETIQMNHSTFAGLSYHFVNNQPFDPFVAFQPGAAVGAVNDPSQKSGDESVSPMIGVSGGVNYDVGQSFHFFLLAKYVSGTYLPRSGSPYSWNGVRVSGGLGIRLHVLGRNK